jgi:mRNA interferase MazF
MGGMSKVFPKRGEIYWVSLKSKKKLPCLVVSNDAGNEVGSRLIIAPLTPVVSEVFPFEVEVSILGKKGKVLLDQVRSIGKSHLQEKIATLDEETKKLIDKALKVALSL